MPDIFEAEETQASRDRRMLEQSQESVSSVHSHPQIPNQSSQNPLPSQEEVIHFPAPEPRHMIGGKLHIFSAFCEMPEGVTFETQEEGERILLLLRKSFITNIPWIVIAFLLAVVPPILLQVLHPENTPLAYLSSGYIFVLFSLYYLFIAAYLFISFITWYFNTSLITTERIVDIDFQDLVYKNIAETKMDLIQDVSDTASGVIPTVFGFGDVLVQTAGTLENFDLVSVPHPNRVIEIIENLIGKEREVGV